MCAKRPEIQVEVNNSNNIKPVSIERKNSNPNLSGHSHVGCRSPFSFIFEDEFTYILVNSEA